jgi:hypothetical protein
MPAEPVAEGYATETAVLRPVRSGGYGLGSDWSAFDPGWEAPTRAPLDRPPRPATEPPTTDPLTSDPPAGLVRAGAPGEVAPVLVLVAALALLEGYRQLNVVPATQWQLSAILFATPAFAVVTVLVRPRRDGRRVVGARFVLAASTGLLILSWLALVVGGNDANHVVGAFDLLFAAVALGTVLANELVTRRTGSRRAH